MGGLIIVSLPQDMAGRLTVRPSQSRSRGSGFVDQPGDLLDCALQVVVDHQVHAQLPRCQPLGGPDREPLLEDERSRGGVKAVGVRSALQAARDALFRELGVPLPRPGVVVAPELPRATVVISGFTRKDRRTTVTKVPVLGDIPLLGFFFRNKTTVDVRTNLFVFITPHIITELSQLEGLGQTLKTRREWEELEKTLKERYFEYQEKPRPPEPETVKPPAP